MKAGFYPKLAIESMKKNAKIYFPFLLACMCCVTALYIACTMAYEEKWLDIEGGTATKAFMNVGIIIIAIFSIIFLFYTNSFLIRRRKKEFGLYHVLGMSKRHIAKIVVYECLFTAVFCIVVGVALGAVFANLTTLLLLKLIAVQTIFSVGFSLQGAVVTAVVFGGIFLLNLLGNIIQVGKAKTIDLLYGGKVGEREPKSNWIMAIVGAVCLIGGYATAQMVQNVSQAAGLFFVAVILVIAGTYATIMAGSTVLLKMLKRNKKFYYKANHFFSVSGMLYRMKQNAAGIASICILFTMLMVTVSITGSLYFGIDSIVDGSMNRDVVYRVIGGNQLVQKREAFESLKKNTELGITDSYDLLFYSGNLHKTDTGYDMHNSGEGVNTLGFFLTQQEYKAITGQDLQLAANEVLFDSNGVQRVGEFAFGQVKVKGVLGTISPKVKEVFYYYDNLIMSTANVVIVSDEATIVRFLGEKDPWYVAGFNSTAPTKAAQAYGQLLEQVAPDSSNVPLSKADMKHQMRNAVGSFLFLGAFLGLLFLMATVLTMYYKQISEGHDDKQRFTIMEKVGMSFKEIRKTIQSQVLLVFFIPILFSAIHMGFASKMINLILGGFGMTDIGVQLFYTIGSMVVFTLLYLVAYVFTARSYYKIVK